MNRFVFLAIVMLFTAQTEAYYYYGYPYYYGSPYYYPPYSYSYPVYYTSGGRGGYTWWQRALVGAVFGGLVGAAAGKK